LLGQNNVVNTKKYNTYANAAKAAKDLRRLKDDEAHAERLVRDYFKGQAKQPEVRHD